MASSPAVGAPDVNGFGPSKRTKVLFWLYSAVLAIGVALVVALLLSLGGYFIFGWESAPVPQIAPLLVYPFVPLIGLRLALGWSTRIDRRDRT